MNGVFGVRSVDTGFAAPPTLGAVGDRLSHRFGGASAFWAAGGQGLGTHARPGAADPRRGGPVGLWLDSGQAAVVTGADEVEGQSPASFAGAPDVVVVADVRIDNRVELVEALVATLARSASSRLPGGWSPPANASDAELIGWAYVAWGNDAPDRILGDFAFAVWDSRAHEHFLARDPVGVRVLYYHLLPGRLVAFASEIKGILAVAGVPCSPNEEAIARWLERDVENREGTLFSGISRLPAGHSLRVPADLRPTAPRRYWDLGAIAPLDLGSPQAYAERFRELLTEAVRCRLDGAECVASALTGGLDSSSVACIARNLLAERGRDLLAFSAVFPGLSDAGRADADESEWIDTVVATGGMTSHRHPLDRIGPLHELQEVLEEQDEPSASVNLFIPRALYAEAARAGVDVYLEGFGGEAAVGYGWEALPALAEAGEWSALGRELRLTQERWGWSATSGIRWAAGSALLRLARGGRFVSLLRALAAVRRETGTGWAHLAKWYLLAPFVPGGLGRSRPPSRAASRTASRTESHTVSRTTSQGPAAAMEYALPFAGRAAAAQGVDVRFPLLDRRLLEFSAGTPDTMGLRDGWTRWLLRESIAGLVPDQIRWRVPKQDLTPGFVRGLLSHDREMVAEFGGTQRGDEEHLAERLQRLSDEAVTDPDEFYAVFQGTSLAAWRARVEAIRNQSAVDVSGGGSRNRRAVSIIRPPRRRSHRPPTTLRDRSWHRYERSSRITESPAAVTPFLVHARS